MRAFTIFIPLLVAVGCLSIGCRSSDTPKPAAEAPKRSPKPRKAPPKVEPLDERPLLAARPVRRKDSERYGAMTQDSLLLLARCGKEVRVPTVVGVLDIPYDNPKGLVAVAEATAEQALPKQEPPEGCAFSEAGYWTRDEDGKGDWVVRYPTTPGLGTSVWWVPDEGKPERRAAEAVPKTVFVARLLRVAAYQADVVEDLDKALALIDAALALDPASAPAAELEGELLLGADSKAAVAFLDTFMKKNGATPNLEATLATALVDLGDAESLARGEALLDKVLAADPGNLKGLVARGERLRAKGDVKAAIDAYEHAVAAHPGDPSPRYNLATLMLADKRPDEALPHLDAYLGAFPEDADALYLRAGLLLDKGDREGAARDAATLVRVAPDNPQVQELQTRVHGP